MYVKRFCNFVINYIYIPSSRTEKKQFHVLISSIQELQRILDGELTSFQFSFRGATKKNQCNKDIKSVMAECLRALNSSSGAQSPECGFESRS